MERSDRTQQASSKTGGSNLSGVMLKTRRDRVVLEPFGYEGSEEHFIPLAPEFISRMHMEEKCIEVQLPKGEYEFL